MLLAMRKEKWHVCLFVLHFSFGWFVFIFRTKVATDKVNFTILLVWKVSFNSYSDCPWSHHQGYRHRCSGLELRATLLSLKGKRWKIWTTKEEVASLYSSVLFCLKKQKQKTQVHTSILIIPPRLEKCNLWIITSCEHPGPLLLGVSLCRHWQLLHCVAMAGTKHRAPIRLHEASKPQSVNLLGLFPFLSPLTVIIFQPPSPDLADRDQMVTG